MKPFSANEIVARSALPGPDISDFMGEDRRGEARHRTVMRAARLSSDVHSIEVLALVRNISEGGMMVSASCNLDVGQLINVSLLDGDRVEGRIIWKDGVTIGIQFSSTIAIDHMLAKPRIMPDGTRVRPPRITLNRNATLRIGGWIADTVICDISQRGAKLRFGRSLAVESRLLIAMNDLRPVSASVKWQVDDLVGVEFHRTLSIEELSKWTETLADSS